MQRSLSGLVAFLCNNLEVHSARDPAVVQILPAGIGQLCKVGGLTPFYRGGTVQRVGDSLRVPAGWPRSPRP